MYWYGFGTQKCCMWNWELKSYKNCTDYRECMCTGNSHTHRYRTCLNHIASQRNSEIWLWTSRQWYWSTLELQRCYVKNWEPKNHKMCTYLHLIVAAWLHGKFSEYTHTEVINTTSTVYTTLDYEYRHKNKGTDLVLVPRMRWVYKLQTKKSTRCVQYRFTCMNS